MKSSPGQILALALVGMLSAYAIADTNDYPLTSVATQGNVESQIRFEQYYENLAQAIGQNPDIVPFDQAIIDVASGNTMIELARTHTRQNLDPIHFAVALYLGNRDAFGDDNVNKVKAGVRLQMPSVRDINASKAIFETLLSEDVRDQSFGFMYFKDPLPKQGDTIANASEQNWQWLKFTNQQFRKPPAGDHYRIEKPAAYEPAESESRSVIWQVSTTTEIVQPVDQFFGNTTETGTYDENGVEICPYCGLPMSVVRSGRLSPDARQGVLSATQEPASSEQVATLNHNTINSENSSITVLGQSEIQPCREDALPEHLKNKTQGGYQLITLSNGIKCIY